MLSRGWNRVCVFDLECYDSPSANDNHWSAFEPGRHTRHLLVIVKST